MSHQLTEFTFVHNTHIPDVKFDCAFGILACFDPLEAYFEILNGRVPPGRGEVQEAGGDRTSKVSMQNNAATAADVGLSRKEIHEARAIRDAEKREARMTFCDGADG